MVLRTFAYVPTHPLPSRVMLNRLTMSPPTAWSQGGALHHASTKYGGIGKRRARELLSAPGWW